MSGVYSKVGDGFMSNIKRLKYDSGDRRQRQKSFSVRRMKFHLGNLVSSVVVLYFQMIVDFL